MEEIWKDIKGFEGLYQVSNKGNVKSIDRRVKGKNGYRIIHGKVLKPMMNNAGYLQVYLCKYGVQRWYKIHRLVAETYLPNFENLLEVNHKDENKKNNTVDNLEWCDRKYNVNYGLRTAKIKAKKIYSHNGKKEIYQFDENCNVVGIFSNLKEAGEKNGFKLCGISSCCHGRRKRYHNFVWRYV